MDYRPPRPDQPYAWDDERLSAYLDGELSAPEQAQLEARLVVDPELRQMVDELRAVRQQLEILPEYRLQATFAEQVLRRAEQEMLLSPLGSETVVSSALNTATAALPIPAAAVQPVIAPLPNRSTARRWQRGVIWTAVAAAAVLLLIVTNRPRGPEQDHVARHDLPEGVAVETGAAKVNTGNTPSPAAKGAVADSAALPALSVDAAHGFGTTPADKDQQQNQRNGIANKYGDVVAPTEQGQNEAQMPLRKQSTPSPTIPSNDGPENNSPANISPAVPPAVASSPMNAAPKPADAAAVNPDPNQMARAADVKGLNPTTQGKMLLKSQAAAPSSALQEKQFAQLRGQLPTELAAFLASDEFSKLGIPRDEKNTSTPAEDQVLVVYLTPRPEPQGDRSFESLLASNSIELADKSLAQPQSQNRLRTFASPSSQPVNPLKEPLAKATSDKKQAAGAKDRAPADMREAGTTEGAGNGPEVDGKIVAPASDSATDDNKSSGNELYYLEAEADQVEDLLRQLRAAPNRFSRLSVAGRGLPERADRTNLRDEKSPAPQSSPAAEKTENNLADSKRGTGNVITGSEQPAQQQPLAQKQFVQGAPPAPQFDARSAGAAAPPATPVAEPAAIPFAAPAPAAPVPPPMTALPSKALPAAAAPAPSAVPSDAPAVMVESAPSTAGLSSAGQATESPSNDGTRKAGADKEGLRAGAQGGRRALQMDKSLQHATGDRVIAYRLRGVESLKLAKNTDALGRGQVAGGGFGGGTGKAGKSEFDNAKASEAGKSDANGEPVAPMKPSAAAGEQKADGVAPGQAANSGNAALPAPPKADPIVAAPRELAEPEKRQEQQPLPKAEQASNPDRLPASGEAPSRVLTRNKEQVTAEEKAPTESVKKSATAPSKRVRVLFVIEHESTKD
jgi:hypothetical protein